MNNNIGQLKARFYALYANKKGDMDLIFKIPSKHAFIAKSVTDGCIKFQREHENKYLCLTIAPYEDEKRTKRQNFYMWALIGKIAAADGLTKDAVYLSMIEKYGGHEQIVCAAKDLDKLKKVYRLVKPIGKKETAGKTVLKCNCYRSTRNYDTEEMAKLIDGIVSECRKREMNIDGLNQS